MIEHFIRITGKFFYLVNGETAEVTHLMAKVYVMLFITCFFRCMRGKYQALSYFFNTVVVFVIEIECRRQTMCFIQMIYIRFKSYFIKQFGAPYTQQNKL